MDIIIDGYNLLHGASITVEVSGAYTLQKSRQALVRLLVATFPQEQLDRTTVVFDAKQAPKGLPRILHHAGITIQFAPPGGDADTLIAELVHQHSAPKSLLVVSSDHAVQRAARRRKAQVCDSEQWFASTLRQQGFDAATQAAADRDRKPSIPLDPEEIAAWVEQFALDDVDLFESDKNAAATDKTNERSGQQDDSDQAQTDKPDSVDEWFNPFPSGYGEDLLP